MSVVSLCFVLLVKVKVRSGVTSVSVDDIIIIIKSHIHCLQIHVQTFWLPNSFST